MRHKHGKCVGNRTEPVGTANYRICGCNQRIYIYCGRSVAGTPKLAFATIYGNGCRMSAAHKRIARNGGVHQRKHCDADSVGERSVETFCRDATHAIATLLPNSKRLGCVARIPNIFGITSWCRKSYRITQTNRCILRWAYCRFGGFPQNLLQSGKSVNFTATKVHAPRCWNRTCERIGYRKVVQKVFYLIYC